MNLKPKLTDHDIIILLALASKACGEDLTINIKDPLHTKQFNSLRADVSKLLTRLDKEDPILPIPSDGKPWAKRNGKAR